MRHLARTAVLTVGVAAMTAAALPLLAAELPPALQSFGVSRAVSAFELSSTSASGFALEPVPVAALGSGVPSAEAMHLTQFAGSTVVSPTLALDAGKGLDIGARFTSFDRKASPFLTPVNAPYLSLANGGRYTGLTYVPAPNLRLRAGTSINSERLDRFRFDPVTPSGPLAMTYDASQTRSILAGVSYDVTSAIGFDVTAISSDRSGVPLGFANASQLARSAQTNAFSVSAHAEMGRGWVTTASFSEGMTQLNQRGSTPLLREQSYSLAIAKHGLFDNGDALGFSFSRPAPSMSGSFSSLIGSGELPPLIISQTPALNLNRSQQAAETDFSVGYVTNFLDGAVALQTNAAYQTNAQGQRGATSVSLLSRAKIKF